MNYNRTNTYPAVFLVSRLDIRVFVIMRRIFRRRNTSFLPGHLGSVGVGSTVGHRQNPGLGVLQAEYTYINVLNVGTYKIYKNSIENI